MSGNAAEYGSGPYGTEPYSGYTQRTMTDFKTDFGEIGSDIRELQRQIASRQPSGSDGSSGSGSASRHNIRDYGAVGDGKTDDYPEIQKALLDAAAETGDGVVHVPKGQYFVGDTLRYPSNVTLTGDGWGISTIQGALNSKPTIHLDNCRNVAFEGLDFTKEAEPNNTDKWYFSGTGHNVRFNHCQWRDLPRQGGMFRGSDYWFSGCRIRNTGRDGLLFVSVDRPIVSNCHFFRTGDDSIAFNAATNNGVAIGNSIVESGYHHAGGGIKQHGNNCAIIGNVFNRPKTYAVRVQNRDEDAANEGPWPNRINFSGNVVNGMNSRGGSKNSAVEIKTINGEVIVSTNAINTYDSVGANRRGMRIRADGPKTRVHIKDTTISQEPNAESKYGVVVENEFDYLEIDGLALYDTSDGITKRNAAEPAGDCEIRNSYFSPGEAKRMFHCADDDGFDTLRIQDNTSKSPGSALASLNNAKFGLVQVHNNLARQQSRTTGTDQVEKLVTGAL